MKQFNNLTISVVFFGSSKFVIPILEVLRKNFNLSLVLTTENLVLPTGRPKANLASQGDALRSYGVGVVEYCVENKIPYRSVTNFSDHSTKYLILNTKSPVAILADFGLIIPQSILNMFPKGIINIHPSLLPKYRGPTPVQTAILNGDKVTGVSIMKLDEEIDHGPILAQTKEPIFTTDTSESLYARLFEKGANLLPKILNKYLKGELKPQVQDHAKATFTKSFTRQDGYVDMSKLKTQNSKPELERMIRAYYPWPGVWTKWKMPARQRLRSNNQAQNKRVSQAKSGGGNGKWKILKFLPNEKLQVEGKKPVSYKDFLNGYPQAKALLKNILSASI